MGYAEIVSAAKAQMAKKNTLFKQREMKNAVTGTLKRHEQKPSTAFNFVIPKQLQLPMSPVDVNDTFFSTDNPFIVREVVDRFVIELKQVLRQDEELHEMFARLGGFKSKDEYDISADEYTKVDFDIFNEYCEPYQVSYRVDKITTKAAGKYGTTRQSPLEYNEDNECIDTDKVMYMLKEFEAAVIEQKKCEYLLKENVETLSQDQKDHLDTIRRSSKIRLNTRVGYLIYLEFGFNSAKECAVPATLEAKLDECLSYMKFNSDELKKVGARKGKRADRHANFWDMIVQYGDGKCKEGDSKELALYNSREYELVAKPDGDDKFSAFDMSESFKQSVNDFLSEGMKGNFEGLANKNIYDSIMWRDDVALKLFEERFEESKKYITKAIYNKFIGIIEKASPELGKELRELSKEGKLAVDLTEVKNALVIEEDTEVSDSIDDEVDSEDVVHYEEEAEDTGASLSELVD